MQQATTLECELTVDIIVLVFYIQKKYYDITMSVLKKKKTSVILVIWVFFIQKNYYDITTKVEYNILLGWIYILR